MEPNIFVYIPRIITSLVMIAIIILHILRMHKKIPTDTTDILCLIAVFLGFLISWTF